MLQVAYRLFREFNAIQENADQGFCDAIFVELEAADNWFIERLRYNPGEGVFVQLPENQELIIIVYRGEITMYVNLHFDCREIQEKYGLTYQEGEQFEYVGHTVVGTIEKVVEETRRLMQLV